VKKEHYIIEKYVTSDPRAQKYLNNIREGSLPTPPVPQ
jgi:hypothetical protein